MEKRSKLSYWISLISLFGLLVCVGIIIFQNSKIGVVTIDTYLGVVATLIGICATAMVGLQIWNNIEFREVSDKIKRIDEIEKDFNDKIADFNKKNSEYIDYVSYAIYCVGIDNPYMDTSINHIFNSLRLYNWDSLSTNLDNINRRSENLRTIFTSLVLCLDKSESKSAILGEGELKTLSKFTIPKHLPDYMDIERLRIEAYDKIKLLIEAKNNNE